MAGILLLGAPTSTLTVPLGVVFAGDSITAGQGANTVSYPSQFSTNTGQSITNLGSGGATAQLANTNYASAIAPSYNASNRNTLVFQYGTNDLGTGRTDVQLEGDIQAVFAKAVATGYYAVIVTLLPRNDAAWDSTKEGYRVDYNSWLRSNWQTFSNGLIDFASIAAMQNTADTTYYQGDQLHPTNLGAGQLAALAQSRFGL